MGKSIVIYSSGSVAAQKLLFRYTDTDTGADTEEGEGGRGDLTGLIDGYFDTGNAGFKQEQGSYERIAREMGGKKKWLFLSDRVEEVEAALAAGMRGLVVVREGNAPLSEEAKRRHGVVTSFDQIVMKK